MRPPAPTWECTYAHDRRNHRHRCRCCGVCLETGDKALMMKVGAFTKRRYTTWAIHLTCAAKPFSGPETGWTWRDAFEAWGTEHLRRSGWEKVLPEHPMARAAAVKSEAA